ncbi:MAG: hypothetical protein AAF962_09285 [Actinomycetota bacterium]
MALRTTDRWARRRARGSTPTIGSALAATLLLVATGCSFGGGDGTALDVGAPVSAPETTVATGPASVAFDRIQADVAAPDPGLIDFVAVNVQLPTAPPETGTAVVALADVTRADGEPIELERIEMPMSELIAAGNRVEVFLPVPLDGSLDIAANAAIDVDTDGLIGPGDWASTELVLITPETARAGVFVNLQPA